MDLVLPYYDNRDLNDQAQNQGQNHGGFHGPFGARDAIHFQQPVDFQLPSHVQMPPNLQNSLDQDDSLNPAGHLRGWQYPEFHPDGLQSGMGMCSSSMEMANVAPPWEGTTPPYTPWDPVSSTGPNTSILNASSAAPIYHAAYPIEQWSPPQTSTVTTSSTTPCELDLYHDPQGSPVPFDIFQSWTPEDDEKVISMYNEGKCAKEIKDSGVLPNRSYLNIETRIRVIRARQGMPANQPRWTRSEAETVRKMYESGKKPTEIDKSKALPHRNYHSIAGYVARMIKKDGKILLQHTHPSSPTDLESPSYSGRGRARRWSPEELTILQNAKDRGMDAKAIHLSHKLEDRSWRAVTLELHRLGTLGSKKTRWSPEELAALREAKSNGLSAHAIYDSQEIKHRSLRAIIHQIKKVDQLTPPPEFEQY
ncbi:MAG: hypothetical protein M4579_003486 [Chaenotheca gracillima]|nr:MAG: hypothetical protein M4579_003486 [Chaenotheca gracillima]